MMMMMMISNSKTEGEFVHVCVSVCVTWFGVFRPPCILCQADGWRRGRKTHTDVASLDLIKA